MAAINVATSSLISQVLSLIDRNRFARLVRETGSERRSKGFSSWDHFVAMLFCQLAQARRLREIDVGLSSCEGKLKHLRMKGAPDRSTLSYANAHRTADLFETLFCQVFGTVSLHAPGKKFRFKSKLYSPDSAVIELCASVFAWAKFRGAKGAAKLHLLLDHDGHLPCYARITEGNVFYNCYSFAASSTDLSPTSSRCHAGILSPTRIYGNGSTIRSSRHPVPACRRNWMASHDADAC